MKKAIEKCTILESKEFTPKQQEKSSCSRGVHAMTMNLKSYMRSTHK
jgi:hypothetical protein